jgi:hypothetical protein
MAYAVCLALLITVSVITFEVETLPVYWVDSSPSLYAFCVMLGAFRFSSSVRIVIEWVLGIFFTVDLLVRAFTCRVWYRWIVGKLAGSL